MNTNSYQITLCEVIIDVVRKDIKNINLAVYPPNGRVRISTPLKLDDEQVRLFAISKLSWIKKQQEKLQNQPRQTPREYVSGETHYFQGQPYRLNVIYQQLPPKVIIRNKSFLDLYVKQGSYQQQRENILIHWYRQELKKIVPPLIEKWQPIIGVEIEEWRIKKMKTKWGTCNIKAKRIWLNLELIKKPTHCLEYVIVHELVHLLERYHNDRFYNYLTQFMPNWRFYQQELNQGFLDHQYWHETHVK